MKQLPEGVSGHPAAGSFLRGDDRVYSVSRTAGQNFGRLQQPLP